MRPALPVQEALTQIALLVRVAIICNWAAPPPVSLLVPPAPTLTQPMESAEVSPAYPPLLGCPHNCSTCLSSGFCTACETGFFLTEGACLPSCPITFYTDSTNTSCIACDISCLSCTGSQSTQCTACISQTLIPQWPFHILFEGQCVSACPSGYGLVNGVCTNICTTG